MERRLQRRIRHGNPPALPGAVRDRADKTGSADNVARATYAVYNAGPGAADRFRGKPDAKRERRIDRRFWEIYQGFAADGQADLLRCTVEPPRAAEATAAEGFGGLALENRFAEATGKSAPDTTQGAKNGIAH